MESHLEDNMTAFGPIQKIGSSAPQPFSTEIYFYKNKQKGARCKKKKKKMMTRWFFLFLFFCHLSLWVSVLLSKTSVCLVAEFCQEQLGQRIPHKTVFTAKGIPIFLIDNRLHWRSQKRTDLIAIIRKRIHQLKIFQLHFYLLLTACGNQ